MDQFPPNSDKAKAQQPREKLEPITSAEPVRRKRGLGHRFKNTFIGGDFRSATDYVFFGVVVPAIRDILYDIMNEGSRRMIYGNDTRQRPSGMMPGTVRGPGSVDYTPYNRVNAPQGPTQRTLSRGARARHDFHELVIPSRQEAEEVIERLYDLLSRYGRATVSDLYELTGVQSNHTDIKWGWEDLRGAKAVRLRTGGFLLNLPEPQAFV